MERESNLKNLLKSGLYRVIIAVEKRRDLQGRVQVPTGGTAREPRGTDRMFLEVSKADSVRFRSRQYSLDERR
jgi:hypothetical protein